MNSPLQREAEARWPLEHATRWFHLIEDRELPVLCNAFVTAGRQREGVLRHWHRLYRLHFGESRSLSDRAFYEMFGAELDAIVEAITDQDLDRFASEVRSSSRRLREFRVPFTELAVSSHLLEESVLAAIPHSEPVQMTLRHSLDKLGHCMAMVIAETYFEREGEALGGSIAGGAAEPLAVVPENHTNFHGMIGTSPPMCRLYHCIEMAGTAGGTLFIIGESGTGKELVARAIHECGLDPERPLVALNCAAIPRDLIESELFGYMRGAFSGARENYLGLFRAADGGTLFLDEITEMSPDVQSKLLRSLQERTVRPVGSPREIPVNARVIASTNRDPEDAMRKGGLRADLYYRLQASVLQVPPLRERREDIPLLADHFFNVFNQRSARIDSPIGLAEDAIAALSSYPWPGNVRELGNAIESAVTFARGPFITAADLPAAVLHTHQAEVAKRVPVPTFNEVERELIGRTLKLAGGNKSKAARMLQISRKKVYDKIAKYGLDCPVWKSATALARCEVAPSCPS